MAYFGQNYFKARYFSSGFLAGIGAAAATVWLLLARRKDRR